MHNKIFFSFAMMLLVLFVSCTTPRPEGKTEAEVLFKEATALMEDDKFLLATEKLNTLKAQHPYSYYAKHAELLLADILFSQENYAEAAAAYIVFRDFHPKYEKIEYVIWRIAESFFKQLPSTFDRDLSVADESIKYFKEIVDKYPSSEYAKIAQENIHICEKMIENKDQSIADFYFKTERYFSARHRYRDILAHNQSEDLLKHAIVRTLESSYRLGEFKECLSDYENYTKKFNFLDFEYLKQYRTMCTLDKSGGRND